VPNRQNDDIQQVHLSQCGTFAANAILSPCQLEVRASSAQTIKGPSGSYAGLAPTCSTRAFQLEPRK